MSAVLAVGALAGCGGSSGSSAATADTAATEAVAEASSAAESDAAKTEIQTEATSDAESAHVAEMVLAAERDPTDMGPWAGNMGGASAIIPLVYEALQIRELNKDAEPCLAKTVEKEDDYTYNVELFDYITDSAGNPLTSSDVQYSVTKAKEIGKESTSKLIDEIEIVDDYNFIVHFSDQAAMGDFEGFFSQFKIVTQAAYESKNENMSNGNDAIGTGPYVITDHTGGSQIVFEARDDYWQTDDNYRARSSRVNADKVTFSIVTEALQRAVAIENGTMDYGYVSLNSKNDLEAKGFGIVPVPDNLTWMLFADMDEASVLSSNKELRQALFYALDNPSISTLFTSGDSVPVYDISNTNYPDYYGDYYSSQDDYYQYDVEKAKELLAESGFDTSQTLKLMCASDEAATDIAEILKNLWGAIGVDVEIISYQSNLLSDVSTDPNNWDLYLLQYASTDYAVNVWEKVLNKNKYSWGGTINFVIDDELQSKLAEVRSADGHTEENVKAFHDYLVDQAWCMGLIQGINYYACSDKLDSDNVVFSEQRIIRPNCTTFNAE